MLKYQKSTFSYWSTETKSYTIARKVKLYTIFFWRHLVKTTDHAGKTKIHVISVIQASDKSNWLYVYKVNQYLMIEKFFLSVKNIHLTEKSQTASVSLVFRSKI